MGYKNIKKFLVIVWESSCDLKPIHDCYFALSCGLESKHDKPMFVWDQMKTTALYMVGYVNRFLYYKCTNEILSDNKLSPAAAWTFGCDRLLIKYYLEDITWIR